MVKVLPIKMITSNYSVADKQSRKVVKCLAERSFLPKTFVALSLLAAAPLQTGCSKLNTSTDLVSVQTSNKTQQAIDLFLNQLGILTQEKSIQDVKNITFDGEFNDRYLIEPMGENNDGYSIRFSKVVKNNIIKNITYLNFKTKADTLFADVLDSKKEQIFSQKYTLLDKKILCKNLQKNEYVPMYELTQTENGFQQTFADSSVRLFNNIKINNELPVFLFRLDDSTNEVVHDVTLMF